MTADSCPWCPCAQRMESLELSWYSQHQTLMVAPSQTCPHSLLVSAHVSSFLWSVSCRHLNDSIRKMGCLPALIIGSASEEAACSRPCPWLGGLRLSSPSQGQEEAGRTSSAHISGQAGGSVLDGETEAQTALTGRVQAGPQRSHQHMH